MRTQFASENNLLTARGLQGFDLVAQRALKLRFALRALADFAYDCDAALDKIAYGAWQANSVLVLCHLVRGYAFVERQLAAQATSAEELDAFEALPEAVEALPVQDLEQVLNELETWPAMIRSLYKLPALLISPLPGITICFGDSVRVLQIAADN